ncbi:zn2+-binding protein melusin contains chord domain protein [Diplodia corticola]|uniref:Zn2+-binding protein melusin contains chord domain protein n=1 Tax=Diplodia corticola TaxID=236234 RepID=A0A1J9RB47_9PEZI|nr:zn2+-binding protein melusin contains chord domain protein [Diplodia corticola]OJD29651.1 zn2+-binding protein melusin contains chord domain protein [Diplodia corticola]
MSEYEARRLANIKRNEALIQELGLEHSAAAAAPPPPNSKPTRASNHRPRNKRRKLEPAAPTRSSARLARAGSRPLPYGDASASASASSPPAQPRRHRPSRKAPQRSRTATSPSSSRSPSPSGLDVAALRARWTSWTPVAPPPARDAHGTYHFASHPAFTPNKSPEEVLREGCFGGTYFRPLRSRALGASTVVDGDWRELPAAWVAGVDVARCLTSSRYDAAVNKYGVACGQSIEEWEAAGWIAHEWDVRGWFQWYCRFWMGRRGADDERQVGRWARCVGERGRWRRALLRGYVKAGVRSVFDDGDEGRGEVSPVVHQTCHHWAWEVRQDALDRFWAEGR